MKLHHLFTKRLILRGVLLFLPFLFVSCATGPSGGLLLREGAKFNNDLSLAIKTSDKITITEHSFWEDFKGSEIDVDVRTAPEYTYRSKTLSVAERAYFAAQVDSLSGAKKVYNHEGCMFAPHYTITFYNNGKKTSSAEVSHRCEDFKWKNGSAHAQSKDLFTALNATLKKTGFNPSSNWKKKATDRYNAIQKQKLEDEQAEAEKPQPGEIPVAKPVPGKPGFLFNPYTQNQVDAEGIPSGTKIIDPQDPKARVFKVP